jgi:hypothetical protein
MRLNIYSQELLLDDDSAVGRELELVTQQADTGITYSAVRMFLKSAECLHDRPGDDDRSAITFWLPKSKAKREVLAMLLRDMAGLVEKAPPETGLD